MPEKKNKARKKNLLFPLTVFHSSEQSESFQRLTSHEYIHAVRIRRVFVRCFASITARVVFVRIGDYESVRFYD